MTEVVAIPSDESPDQPRKRRWRKILGWFGGIGLVLTLIDNLEPLLKLSKIVAFLTANWSAITHELWGRLFGLFAIDLSPPTKTALTIFAVMAAIAASAGLRARRGTKWYWYPLAAAFNFCVALSVLVVLVLPLFEGATLDMPSPYADPFPPIDDQVRESFGRLLNAFVEHYRAQGQKAVGGALIFLSQLILIGTNQVALSLVFLRIVVFAVFIAALNSLALYADTIRAFFV